jgi:4a-hydroxytetrahydrobiopterin dehydratase
MPANDLVLSRGEYVDRVTERITPEQFRDSAGVEDWQVGSGPACAHFATGDFRTGLALVNAIGRLAEQANHHPDVDLRYGGVTVRLLTHEVNGLSPRDVDLAARISVAARELGVPAEGSESPNAD